MTECPHGDIDPSCCAECLDGPPPPLPPEQPDSHPFAAHYLSAEPCPRCGATLEAGQLLVHTTRDRYVHAEHFTPA